MLRFTKSPTTGRVLRVDERVYDHIRNLTWMETVTTCRPATGGEVYHEIYGVPRTDHALRS